MITVADVIRAISERLRALGYPIKDVDITKEIPRPCLVIEAEELKSGSVTQFLREETNGLIVYYFAQRRETGYAELLRLKNDLQDILLEPLEIAEGFYITAGELDAEINKSDMALAARFETYMVQEVHPESGELMEELDWRN